MTPEHTVHGFRRAQLRDVAAITELTQQAYQPWVPVVGGRPAPMDADLRPLIVRPPLPEGCVFVADSPEGIAGVIVLTPDDDTLLVESVAIAPSRQGRGLGRRLLAFAETMARVNQLPAVRLFTHERMARNLRIYQELGYAVTGREPIPGGHLVHLRKDLSVRNSR